MCVSLCVCVCVRCVCGVCAWCVCVCVCVCKTSPRGNPFAECRRATEHEPNENAVHHLALAGLASTAYLRVLIAAVLAVVVNQIYL